MEKLHYSDQLSVDVLYHTVYCCFLWQTEDKKVEKHLKVKQQNEALI